MGSRRSAQRERADRVRLAASGNEEAKRPLELKASIRLTFEFLLECLLALRHRGLVALRVDPHVFLRAGLDSVPIRIAANPVASRDSPHGLF